MKGAFFPFVDGIEALVQAGISAVIQPSGSIRDKEIIKFANRTETILVFSKTHFIDRFVENTLNRTDES